MLHPLALTPDRRRGILLLRPQVLLERTHSTCRSAPVPIHGNPATQAPIPDLDPSTNVQTGIIEKIPLIITIDVGCRTNTANPLGEGWITVRLRKPNLFIANLGVIKIATFRSGMTVQIIARTGMTTKKKAIASMQIMAIPMTINVHYLLIFRASLMIGVVADHRNRGPDAGRPHMPSMLTDRRLRKASGTLPRKK